ncbi:hypothetical protein GCM10010495_63990 [Kitasatospora herbaricolor]|uniref:hypothetical protein n=1 Tax=Kitasatospora herbaricolor TaxID=68217 RepID=UPI0019C05CBD|nr:hypothetical protein [Kitasatospora herbaricolor]MDQ0305923.1 hypothetical protein [Kitasatospora herbaricolor]GGV37976.1 hypothetical protein GCM10010495_63990 [Kitasatospora herbaricolor]
MNPTPEPGFTTTVQATTTSPAIEATGELDLDAAPILHAALRPHSPPVHHGPS